MGFLGTPLGWIMKFLYDLIANYGIALILFTFIIRLALFPLNVRQQKSQARMGLMQPKQKALEKKYGKDKQRYQQELMKLYEEEGYNPMASCLPMLIQMLILFGIVDVVYNPLKHLLQIPTDLVNEANEILKGMGITTTSPELFITNTIQGNQLHEGALLDTTLFNDIFSTAQLDLIKSFDLSFLGINLGQNPDFAFPLILIPILSGLTSLGVTIFSMRQQKKNGTMMEGPNAGMMKGMMYIMPIFSVWIGFSLPSGVGMYWIVGNILSFVQSIVLYTIYSPAKMKVLVEKEQKTKKKKKPSAYQQALRQAREQQAQKDGTTVPAEMTEVEDGEVPEKDSMTAAQRIALARKKMAEKYGDEE